VPRDMVCIIFYRGSRPVRFTLAPTPHRGNSGGERVEKHRAERQRTHHVFADVQLPVGFALEPNLHCVNSGG